MIYYGMDPKKRYSKYIGGEVYSLDDVPCILSYDSDSIQLIDNKPFVIIDISGIVNHQMHMQFLKLEETYTDIISNNTSILCNLCSGGILIRFSSTGGFIDDGFKICNIIESWNNSQNKVPISFLASGDIMSMGIVIFLYGLNRYASKNSFFMIHSLSSDIIGSLPNIEDEVGHLKSVQDSLDDVILKKTNIKKKQLEKIKRSDFYFNSSSALDLGVVDSIL